MFAMPRQPLRINHPSPLIYWDYAQPLNDAAENQSSIPFDILRDMMDATIDG